MYCYVWCAVISNANLNEYSLLKTDFVCSSLRVFSCGPRKSIKRLKTLCPWQLHPFPKYVCGSAESTDFLLCLALYSCKWVYLNLQSKNSPSIVWFDPSTISQICIYGTIITSNQVTLTARKDKINHNKSTKAMNAS